LATPEEMVFFHELCHAAYERAMGKFQKERLWAEEIVAELSAQVLCQLVGKRTDGTLGNSYRYIERFARAAGFSPITACLRVIDEVEKVLSLILGREENSERNSSLTAASDGEDDF
ncbi:MAG: antirestriction protein, partial [Pseudomonadota bacterium]